jgi:hypothetical protein
MKAKVLSNERWLVNEPTQCTGPGGSGSQADAGGGHGGVPIMMAVRLGGSVVAETIQKGDVELVTKELFSRRKLLSPSREEKSGGWPLSLDPCMSKVCSRGHDAASVAGRVPLTLVLTMAKLSSSLHWV